MTGSTFRPGEIDKVKDIRSQTGMSLRESLDFLAVLTLQAYGDYVNLSSEKKA
jgi:hypothetical protein